VILGNGWLTFSRSTSEGPFFGDFVIVDFFVSHWACQKCVYMKIGRHLLARHT
jgi:hypothetical protein